MTNPLVQMRELQKHMKEMELAMQALQADPSLKRELDFEAELQAVLAKYEKTIHEAVQVVDPSFRVVEGAAPKRPYGKRPTHDADGNLLPKKSKHAGPHTIYYDFKNPHTGETIKAANILKKGVRDWVAKYGKDEVLKWRSLSTDV